MKVGDYVRTKFGEIGKLENIGEYNINIKIGKHIQVIAKTEDYKSSPNIIDLIEVGDYVNGYLVVGIVDSKIITNSLILTFSEENIKTVITKEQFSQMEYKVGE